MRVTSTYYSGALTTQLDALSSEQARLQNEASTGQKLVNPEDDPAAMGRVLEEEQEKASLQQYDSNANQALLINETTSSELSSVKELADRAGEIAEMSTGTASATAMQSYGTEVNQLIEQALSSTNTQLDGNYIFGGTQTANPPFTATRDAAGNVTGVAYNGTANGAEMQVDSGTTISPYTSGGDNQNLAGFINTLVKLRDTLKTGNTTAVQAMVSQVTTADNNLVNTIGNAAAVNSRLEAAGNTNTSRFTAINTQLSDDTSADLPSTLVALNQAQNAYQTALQTGAKIMSESLLDYIH